MRAAAPVSAPASAIQPRGRWPRSRAGGARRHRAALADEEGDGDHAPSLPLLPRAVVATARDRGAGGGSRLPTAFER